MKIIVRIVFNSGLEHGEDGDEMEELISFMEELGLNRKCGIIYSLLIKRGEMKATEIIADTGFSSSRVYGFLETLCNHGFVMKAGENPIRYMAVEPDICFSGFIADRIDRLREIESKISEIGKKIRKREKIGVWHHRRRIGFKRRVIKNLMEAKKEIIIVGDKLNIEMLSGRLMRNKRDDIDVTHHVVEDGASMVIIDREKLMVIPRERDADGLEIVLPSLARSVASLHHG